MTEKEELTTQLILAAIQLEQSLTHTPPPSLLDMIEAIRKIAENETSRASMSMVELVTRAYNETFTPLPFAERVKELTALVTANIPAVLRLKELCDAPKTYEYCLLQVKAEGSSLPGWARASDAMMVNGAVHIMMKRQVPDDKSECCGKCSTTVN